MLHLWRDILPSWPDPHEDGPPADEEYSRVTDGERYRIVVERARAWTAACATVLGAQVLPLDANAQEPGVREAWTIAPRERETSPLRVAVFEATPPSIALGCGDATPISRLPDCGCDACDCGSESLLEAVDDWFTSALTGELAHIWGQDWSATSAISSKGCGGSTDAPVQLDFDEACSQLDVILAGGEPELPTGLRWVWSGRWGVVSA